MNEFVLFYIVLYLITTPLAAMLWPRRQLVLWVWALPAILVYPILWQTPGIISVVFAMVTLIIFLRALDANASFAENKGSRYALYCHYLLTHQTECRLPESVNKRLLRLVRGCLFIGLSLALMSLGKQIELWRSYPYLDDMMMLFELGFAFVGMIEIITAICMTLGIQFFIVDACPADFAFPPSLRAFWTRWWNRPTSGVLKRGIFLPSGGKRNRIRGLMLVFFACGVMHAAPLVLAGEQKMLWFILALGALGFFMIHAIALSLENFFPRRFRQGVFARVFFYLVMLIALPLYPAPGLIAFGAHNRPPETASVLLISEYLKSKFDSARLE